MSKQAFLNHVASRLTKIEADLGNTANAWKHAWNYLNAKGVNTYFLTAVGIGLGKDVREWMKDYYVEDEQAGPKIGARVEKELAKFDDDGVYLSNQGYDAYNRSGEFMPDKAEPADSDTIHTSFSQMISSLHDFPERY